MTLLDVRALGVHYPGDAGRVVDDLSFTIAAGESLGLVGESGSGKTQTALAIMRLLPQQARISGHVSFQGQPLLQLDEHAMNRIRARRIAMVFQDPAQALNPYLRIGEQLQRVLAAHAVVGRRGRRARSLELLRRVRLPDAARRLECFPHQLSGGMRQRAMIAAALAAEPALLIADEPTTALDVTVQAQILDLLLELRRDAGIALLLITHDLGVIAGNCDRMLVMHQGKSLETGTTTGVFARPSHPHTRRMLATAPRIDSPAAVGRPPADPARVLEVERLSISFAGTGLLRSRRRALHAVRDVSFALAEGETLAIVGESGSGKTTVARAILGLVSPNAGSIRYLGAPLAAAAKHRERALRRSLQMVFQDPVGSLNPAMRIGEILNEAIRLDRPDLDRGARRARAREMLRRVGLEESLVARLPHELSGGQAQRVAIARALSCSPRVLICDEAVAALDNAVRREILDLLAEEQRQTGLSIVFITHDLAVVRRISHRVMVMYLGRVCESAGNDALFRRPRHPYTRALMDAVPAPDPTLPRRGLPLAGAASDPASTLEPPPGCAFHPRCAYAVEACRARQPAIATLPGGHVACHRAAELDLSSPIRPTVPGTEGASARR